MQQKVLTWKSGGKENGFNSHSIQLRAFWKTRQKGKHHGLCGLFTFSLVTGSRFIFLILKIKKLEPREH